MRFYVKYFDGKEWKRGAVFISEIVPKPMIALLANKLYKEHYSAMPMRHSIGPIGNGLTQYLYEWKLNGTWNRLGATVSDKIDVIDANSPEEFIFEHYWGYNKVSETRTNEYQVEHIRWQTRKVTDPIFDADITMLYGDEFVPFLGIKPYSAFFADGSEITVRTAAKIIVDPAPPVSPVL